MKYQGLLFDVDGVLVESEKKRFEFLKTSCQKQGIVLPEEYFFSVIGKSTPSLISEIFNQDDKRAEAVYNDYLVFKNSYIQRITPISATVNFILHYRGKSKIGIATSNSRDTVIKLLQCLKINDLVSEVVTRDDVVNQKPHPESYLRLSSQLHIDPSDCVVIEDTVVGATAGVNAGMDCFIFLNSYNNKQQFNECSISGYISSTDDLNNIAL